MLFISIGGFRDVRWNIRCKNVELTAAETHNVLWNVGLFLNPTVPDLGVGGRCGAGPSKQVNR